MTQNFTKAGSIAFLKERSPLVHCITNDVAMNFCANTLSALGASPIMAFAPQETAEFVDLADCLTVNIGTLISEQQHGIKVAMERAQEIKKPVIVDPVAHFASSFRQDAIKEILAYQPTVIRGNSSEILGFVGKSSGKGVDSRDAIEDSFSVAIDLAQRTNAIVAVSGKTDFVTDGKQHYTIEGGHPLMPKVSATGCALTCVIGAFVALTPEDPLQGTIDACSTFAVAGEIAGRKAEGPGSFVPLFLDALYKIDDKSVSDSIKITRLNV